MKNVVMRLMKTDCLIIKAILSTTVCCMLYAKFTINSNGLYMLNGANNKALYTALPFK